MPCKGEVGAIGTSFAIPDQPAGRVLLAKAVLAPFLNSDAEILLWIGDWGIWPSGEHLPLFLRLHEALGEKRPLMEACGHLTSRAEAEDATSVLVLAVMFLWDCHILSGDGKRQAFFSHDEFGKFSSDSESEVREVETWASRLLKPN